jgi:hypothetical protein
MSKDKIIIAVFVVLSLVLSYLGMSRVKLIKSQIIEQMENTAKLNQRLEYVDGLAMSLETEIDSGRVIGRIPQVNDPIANQVLMQKFIQNFLLSRGMEAEVKAEKERKSNDFPSLIGVNEVPITVGVKDYSSLTQIIGMLDDLRSLPFGIEALCIGGGEIPIPGNLRLRIKYYIIPEAS